MSRSQFCLNFNSRYSVTVAPGQSSSQTTVIYTGPEDADRLAELAQGLALTVDYGWLWFISDILFRGLVFIQAYLGSWGLSIIAITILVKIAFYKLSEASYAAVAKQKKLQPKIEEVNRKYSENPEQKSKAMLALYQKEGVNPLSGCLPTLLQMPFFIALYYVLVESVQLRFQPFLWLPDLSARPFFHSPDSILLEYAWNAKISPVAQTDESQANAMLVMPFVASILFAQMPSRAASILDYEQYT